MSARLPPLSALRAFEAAGRHLSFTNAARELFVTQAAVSHQIKALEEHLGVTLFKRYNRRLELTAAGAVYLPEVSEAFATLTRATHRLRPAPEARHLRITTLASFTTKWLIPRLSRFQQRHPEIEPMISTTQRPVDLLTEEFDVAIRVGGGRYPGLEARLLMRDWAFPVCASGLVDGAVPLSGGEHLARHVLVHDSSVTEADDGPNWRQWLQAAGIDDVDADRGLAYTDTGLTIQAAIAGQGVALGRLALVADDLERGHLVRPFGPDVPTASSWYFLTTPEADERHAVKAFRDWLEEEIAAAGLAPS